MFNGYKVLFDWQLLRIILYNILLVLQEKLKNLNQTINEP